MIIFPAIDILEGKVVRLRQGDYDDVTVYNEDPVDQAKRWEAAGAEWIHVVDLDGAATGEPKNLEHVRNIAAAVGIPIQVGGGIRSMETLRLLHEAGVKRTVLGTSLVTQRAFVARACNKYDGIVAGIDVRGGKIAVDGWRHGAGNNVLDLIHDLQLFGIGYVVYTDIARDGMQHGVNAGTYRDLSEQTTMRVIASGGVGSLDDIARLYAVKPALEGVIVGKALYENTFTLEAAIAAGRGEKA